MSLTRRQFSRALVVPALLTGAFGLVGCGEDPDQTGPEGIGAPGKLPDVLPPEEGPSYEEQMKREQELMQEESSSP